MSSPEVVSIVMDHKDSIDSISQKLLVDEKYIEKIRKILVGDLKYTVEKKHNTLRVPRNQVLELKPTKQELELREKVFNTKNDIRKDSS